MSAANEIFSALVRSLDENATRGSIKMHICEDIINELDNQGWTSQNDSIIEFQPDDWVIEAFRRAGHVLEEVDDATDEPANGGPEAGKASARGGRSSGRSDPKSR